MKLLIEYLRSDWRWWLGLLLTLIVTGLLVWNIMLTKQLLSHTKEKPVTITGYSEKRLDEMWMKINSMERIIHTIPLVECGDWNEKR